MAELPVCAINRCHLEALTGPLGIWQHASAAAPNTEFGYCTDDVARALIVDLLHARELGWPAVAASASRSLGFLREAFDLDTRHFRNFRAGDGSWNEETGSEDSQGRAVWALASAIGAAGDAQFAGDARRLFAAALPVAGGLRALRASSSALIGCDVALDTHLLDPTLRADTVATFEGLAMTLSNAFSGVDVHSDWPWPEPVLTYENALLPHALLTAGRRLDDDGLRQTGRWVLEWLMRVHMAPNGMFSPVGSNGWWRRGGARSRFDQQPIEATAMLLGCETAFREFGDERYLAAIEAAYGWFLGRNDLGLAVAVVERGACHDGLTPCGVNLNQGAESTLMWLITLEHVRRIRRETAAGSPVDARPLSMSVLVESRR